MIDQAWPTILTLQVALYINWKCITYLREAREKRGPETHASNRAPSSLLWGFHLCYKLTLQCWSQLVCWLTHFPQLDIQVTWPAPVSAQALHLSIARLAIPLQVKNRPWRWPYVYGIHTQRPGILILPLSHFCPLLYQSKNWWYDRGEEKDFISYD